MKDQDFAKLAEDTEAELLAGASSVGVLGATQVTLRLLERLRASGLVEKWPAVYTPSLTRPRLASFETFPVERLADREFDILVVAADGDKELLLEAALPYIVGAPKVIVAGYAHLAFRDSVFEEEYEQLLAPSIANGYPNTLVHLYQCLQNASRLNLIGTIAEFGTYKGGTAAFLARVAARLGQDWPVLTFDTFGGFPPRVGPLDMYDHPECVFTDVDSVSNYLSRWSARVIVGDIRTTAASLQDVDLVLTFIDTDNFHSAMAATDVAAERTVVGGAIVFDHFTGVDRFRYTLGERMAAKSLLDDARYFNLHGTGVFIRQK